MTHHDGAVLTGSAGQCEIWTDDQDARGDVGESCALAYQLRVYDSLLRLNADPRMGDLMERTIFNALFASQSPDGRRLRYFAPLEGNRVYWKTDTYCCPCNFRRIIAELPAFVFYRADDGITVNLYTPAQAKLNLEQSVTVRQETDYPNSGRVRLSIAPEKPVTFTLRLRIPSWATKASVTVNGQPARGAVKPGTFFELRREWKPGDQVELDLPMDWRLVKGRQRQAGRVAVMRGPQVFCLDPAQNPALAKLDGTELGYSRSTPPRWPRPCPTPRCAPTASAAACKRGNPVSAWGRRPTTNSRSPSSPTRTAKPPISACATSASPSTTNSSPGHQIKPENGDLTEGNKGNYEQIGPFTERT